MIKLDSVSKRYGAFEALKNVSLEIGDGEFVVIAGHSGAGKSTLLKLMAAIEPATQGSILINGQNLAALRPAALPYLRRRFGLVFQDHKLLFDRTAFDNVMLPLAIAGFPRREAEKRTHAALDKVGLLAREKAMPVALSGGEQQRLCIARAVVSRPAFLLADEPTGNLDAGAATDIIGIFRAFHEVGVTVVVATHDAALCAGAREIRLSHGEVCA